jgi:hypothetical protein
LKFRLCQISGDAQFRQAGSGKGGVSMTNTCEMQALTELRGLTDTELDAVCGGHNHRHFGSQLSNSFNNLLKLFSLFNALEHGFTAINSFNTVAVAQSIVQIAVIIGNNDSVTQVAQNNATI